MGKEKIQKGEILEGAFSNLDFMSPSYINLTDPKTIEIDGMFYSNLLIVDYDREQNDLILKDLLDTNINMNISMFYEKKDNYKAIRELTYHIGNVGVDLKDGRENKQDIDIAAFTYQDAKYIRKQIQVNHEDIYYLYLYISVFSENKKELEYLVNKTEGILQGRGLQTRRAYFRQEQVFRACMPIMEHSIDIKKVTKRNVLTTGLVSTYPFLSSNIFDEKGILIGTNIYNNSLVFIDRYDTNQYKNANMCIFGTSGAGKSYYTKLSILRNAMLGIEQYIIDPEREYQNLSKQLKGTLIKIGPTSSTYINIMDIREESIEQEEKGYLEMKLGRLMGFFELIFGEMQQEERAMLEEKVIQCYQEKGITFENESLYQTKENSSKEMLVFKEAEDMPILEDLQKVLEKEEATKSLAVRLQPFTKGAFKFFNHHTNIKIQNPLIIADIYELGEENIKYGMYLFIELFWDKIKINREKKKAIYLDEIWQLIGVTSNPYVASFIYRIFKTIRKYGGSAVAITQDVSDLFGLEGGAYGKSILNNSSIKTFFALEEENIKILSQYTDLSEKEKIEIKTLKRGECLMFVGDTHILTKIEANEFEQKCIS